MTDTGLYAKPENNYLAEIVSFVNPDEARDSVHMLREEFEYAESYEKRLKIKRVALYASNRAKANMNKRELSDDERNQFKEISKIYRKGYDDMKMPKKEEI